MFPGTPMLDSLFWMLLGALQIPVVLGAYRWCERYGRRPAWWQMALMYAGFVSLCLTIGGGFTLMGEYETAAGWRFMGFLGVPQVIVLFILARLFVFRRKAA